MRPRKLRISRIYHHWTRRQPDRHAQWKQISQLRPHGNTGHLSSHRRQAYVPEEPLTPSFMTEQSAPELEYDTLEEYQPPVAQPAGGAILVALATSLFLLGCAYAAFAGYVLSIKSALAYVGVIGSVVSLLAAGIGVCLAASREYGHHSARFLSLSVIILSAVYGVLLCLTIAR